MKKTIAILLIVLTSALLLASCSSADMDGSVAIPGGTGSSANQSLYMEYSGGDMAFDDIIENYPAASTAPMAAPMPAMDMASSVADNAVSAQISSGSGVVPVTAPEANDGLAEKIIYSVYADIETVDFDRTVNMVYELLAFNGAFIESSYIGGRNYAQSYHGWQTYRNANFSLRVPKDRLNAVTASLDTLGNVTSLRSDAENITSQFFDTQSRLNSYRTQDERLLDMLGRADNVADMIAIEQRLADVRYVIESLTTTLNNWQNRVDYSTVTLFIVEVETFTEITPVQQRTYWQQIGDGLQARTIGVGRFFMNLFKWLTVNLPVLIILAVIVVVVVLVLRKKLWRRKESE